VTPRTARLRITQSELAGAQRTRRSRPGGRFVPPRLFTSRRENSASARAPLNRVCSLRLAITLLCRERQGGHPVDLANLSPIDATLDRRSASSRRARREGTMSRPLRSPQNDSPHTLPIVYLARHGETAWTISHQHTGLTDLALTAPGEADEGRTTADINAPEG